jgi:UDP-glucose 4-epimerase
MEAVRTNVLGTENVLERRDCRRRQARGVLSTDKAVYPINAMGISKAMMGKAMVARAVTWKAPTPSFVARAMAT